MSRRLKRFLKCSEGKLNMETEIFENHCDHVIFCDQCDKIVCVECGLTFCEPCWMNLCDKCTKNHECEKDKETFH